MDFSLVFIFIYSFGVSLFNMLIYLFHSESYLYEKVYQEHNIHLEYDYIIVGAGSAGSLVAGRLAEDGTNSVLLLEAGADCSRSILNIPVVTPLLQGSLFDWQYETVKQGNACYALKGQVSKWPMGKIVGGTSRLNSLVYLQGNKFDFDLWGEAGDISWHYDEEERLALSISTLPWSTSLVNTVLQAGLELGYQVSNLNTEQNTGFMPTQVNMRNGSRWGADSLFLRNQEKLSNLRILPHTLVEKVMFLNGFEAYGVQFHRFGRIRRVLARKEVILTAGVIGSAKILMLSGVGPKNNLEELGIPVVKDLPVGQNLQDHVTTGLDLIRLNQSLPFSLEHVANPLATWSYYLYGSGPWTAPGCEVVALVNTNQSSSGPPDLQIMVLPTGLTGDYGIHLRHTVGISEEVWEDYFSPLLGHQVVSLLPILLHPKSRGELRLASRHFMTPPIIDPCYLCDAADVETLYKGIVLVKKLIGTEAFQKLGAQLHDVPMPGCRHLTFDTELYWKCYIVHLTLTSYHPVGTCKMGHPSDPSSVVDTTFRVLGTNRLRVIDGSVMPTLPSGNIQATILMIAEKGVDAIKLNWHHLRSVCHQIEVLIPRHVTPTHR